MKIKTGWIIEYWNNKEKSVECFSSEDGSWEEAPKENVIIVYVQRMGIRPYGRADKLYTQILRGTDNYFLQEKDGIAIFGMWNDDGRLTVVNIWYSDGRIESKVVTKRLKGIPDKIVKTGIWVEEPWATKLGLSHSVKREIKGCYG